MVKVKHKNDGWNQFEINKDKRVAYIWSTPFVYREKIHVKSLKPYLQLVKH